MKIQEILLERSNRSGQDQILKYVNDSNIFVTFTIVNKIGINPKSDFQTPLAIYTFPLKEAWQQYQSLDRFPFVTGRPYIWVISPTKPTRDVSEFNQAELDKTIEFAKTQGASEEDINSWIKSSRIGRTHTKGQRKIAASIWNITRKLAASSKTQTNIRKWNKILREVLGYDVITDRTGIGVIHSSEPIQAIFLTPNSFKVVELIYNKPHSKYSLPDFENKAQMDKFIEANVVKPLNDYSHFDFKEALTILRILHLKKLMSFDEVKALLNSIYSTSTNSFRNNFYNEFYKKEFLNSMLAYIQGKNDPKLKQLMDVSEHSKFKNMIWDKIKDLPEYKQEFGF
jgi:hypothetical protein